jgi:hypothetical protein
VKGDAVASPVVGGQIVQTRHRRLAEKEGRME